MPFKCEVRITDRASVIAYEDGCIATPREIADICEKLMAYAIDNKDKIDEVNAFTRQCNKDYAEHRFTHGKKEPNTRPSHVYLMECFGMYKVGVSIDVEKRCKQFRSKQFPVKIVASSKLLKWAYDMETDIHAANEDKCVGGEWFKFTDKEVEHLSNLIMQLDDDLYERGL